jgi:hypothetical protein
LLAPSRLVSLDKKVGWCIVFLFPSYVPIFFVVPIALASLLGVSATTTLAVTGVDDLFSGGSHHSHRFVLVGPLGTAQQHYFLRC